MRQEREWVWSRLGHPELLHVELGELVASRGWQFCAVQLEPPDRDLSSGWCVYDHLVSFEAGVWWKRDKNCIW